MYVICKCHHVKMLVVKEFSMSNVLNFEKPLKILTKGFQYMLVGNRACCKYEGLSLDPKSGNGLNVLGIQVLGEGEG